jgi:hypothetical protein
VSHGRRGAADSQGRYYVLTGLDMWTDQFFATGTRTTGNGTQRFAIVDPQWTGNLPPMTEMFRSPTAQGWLLGRAQTNGPQDFENVLRFQDGYAAVPLSRVGSTTPLPSPPSDPMVDVKTPPPQLLAALSAASFLDFFSQAMTKNPPHAND